MADTVQYRMERMVNELDDLETRGLFTREEIAEIVKQRRKYEYRLKRPSPLKQDFLAYIDYETQLDTLRRLRKKMVSRELKKKGNKKMKMSVSDYSIVTRIVDIYRQAVSRFKGDVGLWFKYLEFCREKRNGRIKKVLAQLIRFHPKVPGVWIYAAAWEFDHNLNVTAARALMHSGLRVCPTSEDLWVEYLRMELTYLNKLKARKVALGEDKGSLIRDTADAVEKQWRDENNELFMSLDKENQNKEGSDVDGEESEKKEDLFQAQGFNILRTVYSGAVEALPSSFTLRRRFLEILEALDLSHSEDFRKEILSDMKRDFSKDPVYWDWLARFERSGVGFQELQKTIQVYEEALQVLPSPVMFSLYTKCLTEVIASIGEDLTEDYILQLLSVYEKAEAMQCLNEDLACEYVAFYLQLKRVNEVRKLAEKLCTGKLSDSVKLWILRASLEIRLFTLNTHESTKADLKAIFELLSNALVKIPVSKAEDLWVMALKFFATERKYANKLVEMSITSVAKHGTSDDGFSLPSAVVNFILQRDGMQQAREMYKRFLGLPRPGLALYRNCIELEQNLASAGDKECLVNARKLYESALTSYDQDISLWKDYYAMEVKLGTSETTNAIQWRARKTLRDNAAASFLASSNSL